MLENRILDALSQTSPDVLRNRLKPIDFVHGDLLADSGSPIQHAIFPRSGLISVVVDLQEGERIEVGMVGPYGALGGAAIFGATLYTGTAFAQLPGRAWAMRVDDLIDAATASAEFREMMFAQEQYLLAQAQQTAACNAKHTIMHRLCSWLLRAHDACGGGELMLTQENLAQMLGVQRASVSMFASQLQEQGLIHYRRGRLQIADAHGLASHACECRSALRQQHNRLFAEALETNGAPAAARQFGAGGAPASRVANS
jgi:CRP-like cAMP-binding protein